MAIPRKSARLAGLIVLLALAATATRAAKRIYNLTGPGGGSASGIHWISLPYTVTDPQLQNCCQLLNHIPMASQVARLDNPTDNLDFCVSPTNCFALDPGEAYQVQVLANSMFEVEGYDDAAVVISMTSGGPTGSQLVALPFETAATTAQDLINEIDFSAGSPAVTQVARYNTATDVIETYNGVVGPNFGIVPGQGYRVRVNDGFNYTPSRVSNGSCSTSMLCDFQGLSNSSLGGSSLFLNAASQLVIGGVGAGGDDGVQVDNDCGGGPAVKTGHEDWIDLGRARFFPINKALTPNGAFILASSTADLSGAIQQTITLRADKISSSQIDFSSDFSATQATGLAYEVYGNGVLLGGVTGQTLASVASADDWPSLMAFSLIEWDHPVTVTLPNLMAFPGADEMHIVPENRGRTLLGVHGFSIQVKGSLTRDISELIIVEEAIDGACAAVGGGKTPAPVPANNAWTAPLAALLLLGLLTYVVNRKARATP